jgi:hypothetical protein
MMWMALIPRFFRLSVVVLLPEWDHSWGLASALGWRGVVLGVPGYC